MPDYIVTDFTSEEQFLQGHVTTQETAQAVLYRKNNCWHLLTADETPPENEQLYSLTEDDLNKFVDTFKPKVKFNDEEQKIIQDAILLATQELRAITSEEIRNKQPAHPHLHLSATENGLDDVANILATAAAEKQNAYLTQSLNRTTMPGIAGLQDALWMTQGVALTDGLNNIGTHSATMLASGTKLAGIALGAAASVVMGVACGLLSSKIYEEKAIQQYKTHHKKAPTGDALKFIKRDAKNFGLSVFGSMTGWTIGAGLMQGAFYVAKAIAGLTPHGLIVNIAVSVAAGLGQSIISCVMLYRAEKARCHNIDGTLDEVKWKQLSNSSDFKKSMLKTAVASFVAGFAWNMIGSYLPAPVQHAIKHGAQAAKQAASVAATAAAAGFSTFLTFCGASVIPILFHNVKNFFWGKDSTVKEKIDPNPISSKQP